MCLPRISLQATSASALPAPVKARVIDKKPGNIRPPNFHHSSSVIISRRWDFSSSTKQLYPLSNPGLKWYLAFEQRPGQVPIEVFGLAKNRVRGFVYISLENALYVDGDKNEVLGRDGENKDETKKPCFQQIRRKIGLLAKRRDESMREGKCPLS